MSTSDFHPWAHPITLAYLPAYHDQLLDSVVPELLDWLRSTGTVVQETPTNDTDLMVTTARFNHPVDRDEALLFHGKRKYQLSRRPQVLTIVSLTEAEYAEQTKKFAELAQRMEDEIAHVFDGVGPQASDVLIEQARRGGPEVALGRLMQGQNKSIRVMALIGDSAGKPKRAIHYDLAGAHPSTDAKDMTAFVEETGKRIMTAICAHDVDHHDLLDETLPRAIWEKLTTPEAMMRAGATFTKYGFFTTPISIEKVLGFRGGLGEAIAAQYSEGCYAVFDPDVPGLITTATGSSRLVDKRSISRDDQAIVVGVKADKQGAKVIQVEGRGRVIPSVEAVEMMGICEALPYHTRRNSRNEEVPTPAVHAILHGHLGLGSYDPTCAETVMLEEPYYDYLVSCGTGALASGTARAFQRSEALRDLNDPRGVIVLEQPGHGVVVVEKWVEGKGPFEVIREYLEKGLLKMTMEVPQGRIAWEERSGVNGHRVLAKPDFEG